MKLIRQWLKFFKPWWMEPALPVVLAVIIFIGLSYILVAGTKRDQLSSAVEASFIKFAVKHASQNLSDEGVVVVSVVDDDFATLRRSNYGFLRDLSLEHYVAVAEQALQNGAKTVYLSWIPSSQPPDSDNLAALLRLAKTYGEGQLYVGYPVEELPYVDPYIRKHIHFLEADDCGWDVQVVCSYNHEWKDWIIQHLVNTHATEKFVDKNKHFISSNLPHFRPNYIMNLPRKAGLKAYSFTEVLQGQARSLFKDKIVFIGPDLYFPELQKADKILVRRTYIAEDSLREPIAMGGTPFHVMWAQIAAMLRGERYVAVAPLYLSSGLAAIFCLLILYLLARLGAVMALGTFLIIAFSLPFANILGIALFQVYVPVFDIIYSGLIVFLFTAMGYLSFQTYQKWRFDQLMQAHAETADLRRNFLAIVSHNLNTPIAQMQGLTDILVATHPGHTALIAVASKVAMMQLFVRSVLIQSAVESAALNEKALSPQRFIEDFRQSLGKTLAKVGVRSRVGLRNVADEYNSIPVSIDERVLAHVIVNILLLVYLQDKTADSQVDLRYDEEGNHLEIQFYWPHLADPASMQILAPALPASGRILTKVFRNLVHGFVKLKKAEFTVSGQSALLKIPV